MVAQPTPKLSYDNPTWSPNCLNVGLFGTASARTRCRIAPLAPADPVRESDRSTSCLSSLASLSISFWPYLSALACSAGPMSTVTSEIGMGRAACAALMAPAAMAAARIKDFIGSHSADRTRKLVSDALFVTPRLRDGAAPSPLGPCARRTGRRQRDDRHPSTAPCARLPDRSPRRLR